MEIKIYINTRAQLANKQHARAHYTRLARVVITEADCTARAKFASIARVAHSSGLYAPLMFRIVCSRLEFNRASSTTAAGAVNGAARAEVGRARQSRHWLDVHSTGFSCPQKRLLGSIHMYHLIF